MVIADCDVKIDHRDTLRDRPIQEKIEESMSVYKPGEGWDALEAQGWFGEQTKENSGGESEEESEIMSPPKKQNETRKHSENMLILKSISKIRLCNESNEQKNYQIKCDYSWATSNNKPRRDPLFKEAYREVTKKDEWDCSVDYVRTLPFEQVKAFVPGKWVPIGLHTKKLAQQISRVESLKLNNYQLWRWDNGHPVIRATTAKGKEMFIQHDALIEFGDEPWTAKNLRTLSSVRSYCIVTLGEGSRATCDDDSPRNGPPDPWENPADGAKNIWWSRENLHKNCLVGSITNLLHHMQAGQDAFQFKRLSALEEKSLLKELNEKSVPRKIKTGDGSGRDEFGRCLWLLRKRFNCQITQPVKADRFGSVELLARNAKRVKFPLVLSIEITNSPYNHVICLWRDMIIDFEEETTIPLTENNIRYSFGRNSTFVRVVRGYGIFPSKNMNKACRALDIKEWGRKSYDNGENAHLFENEGRRRRFHNGEK